MPYELGYHGSSVSYQTVQSAIAHVYINLFLTRSSSHPTGPYHLWNVIFRNVFF